MSANDYLTADEAAQMRREFEREVEKLESRLQRDIDAVKLEKRGNTTVTHHPNKDTAELRVELRELRQMLMAITKLVKQHQAAIEELVLLEGEEVH